MNTTRSSTCISSTLLAVLLLTWALWPSPAHADEATRVFVRYAGGQADAIAAAAGHFEAVLLAAGNLELAGTSEMEAVYADCAEEIGADAATQRDCQLRAANRLFVEHLLELDATATTEYRFEIVLSVWNPSSNAKVHAAIVEVDGATIDEALRGGLPLLAAQFRCFRGEQTLCVRAEASFDSALVPAGGRARGSETTPTERNDTPCPLGQEVSPDTAGRCCWPDQVWSGTACVGRPTRCPEGMTASAEEQACILPTCEGGRQRTSDGIHCCWPGQGWSTTSRRCVGAPSCPDSLSTLGESCTPDRDQDGVVDARDQCVIEREDFDGIFDDDGCPDIDMDGDGIPDEKDRCMLHPEDFDGFEDDDGCREEHDVDRLVGWSLVGGGLGLMGAGLVYELATNPDVSATDNTINDGTATDSDFTVPGTIMLGVGAGATVLGAVWLLLPPDLPDLQVSSDGTRATLRWRTVF